MGEPGHCRTCACWAEHCARRQSEDGPCCSTCDHAYSTAEERARVVEAGPWATRAEREADGI